MKRIMMVLVCLVVFFVTAAAQETVNKAAETKLTDADKLYWLSLLWSEAKYNFVYFDQVPDLDWDATYREFIPKMLATTDELECYRTLQAFMASLKDGHTFISLPNRIRERFDQPPLNVQEIEGLPVVTSVARELSENIPLGSVVLEVDGTDSKDYIQESIYPFFAHSTEHVRYDLAIRGFSNNGMGLLMRQAGSKIMLKMKTPAGEIIEMQVTCDRSSKDEINWVSALQKPKGLLAYRWLEEGILYIALNSFNDPKIIEEFKAILPEVEKAKGVVLDIRFNSGGNTNNGTAILDYFADHELTGSKWKTREHRSAQYAWGRNLKSDYHDTYGSLNAWFEGGTMTMTHTEGQKFLVPVVVLIDYFTASAAEDFLIFADQLDHFTFVGRPTNGSTGQPVYYQLPDGGVAGICAKRDTYPDGRDFVGYGIQPDVPAAPTIRSIAEGTDAVLEKGLEVIKQKVKEDQGHAS